ncbi:MAG: DUF4320 family protein [Clostridiales bacterium]|jgi:hypothetical protein|nr:DUF4320 family protein [Clostridiales bacterium]
MNRCKNCLKNNRGDIYFEFLICMILFIFVLSLCIQLTTSVQLKFWLDRQTAAIVRHVQISGEVDAAADEMISGIRDRLGDSVSNVNIEWDTSFITGTNKIQLGNQVRLIVRGELSLFRLGKSEIIKVDISSEMAGTCERYWKN